MVFSATKGAPLSAMEAKELGHCMLSYVSAIGEKFRQELIPLVYYIRRGSAQMAEQGECLMMLSILCRQIP